MPHKFRELDVWQRSMDLVTQVYELTRDFPREELYGLTSQVRRAIISVPLNIAEGAGCESPAEFARFLNIAMRSLNETATALEIAERLGYCTGSAITPLLDETHRLSGMLTNLGRSIRKRSATNELREEQTGYETDITHDTKPIDAELPVTNYQLPITNYIVLLEATPADAETILAVELAAFEEYRDTLVPPSGVLHETVDVIRTKMTQGTFVLAMAEGAVVGSVFYQDAGEHVYLGRLSVLPVVRRRGIGAALLAEVERRALALGRTRIRLGVRVALPQLRARYERHGYRVVEAHSHEGFSEPTFLYLEKRLFGG